MIKIENDEKPLMLVFPFGLLAHYLRCLVLCRELKKHFRIRFLFHREYHSFIRREGFETFECAYLDPVRAVEGVKNFDFSWLERDELERLFLAQVGIIQQSSAAVVLGDYTPTLKMAASKTRTQFISLTNGYMSKYYAGTRKIPKGHPASRLIRYLPAGLASGLTLYGESLAFQKLHQPFKLIRKRYDLDSCSSYPDELEGDLNLICDLPEIFPQKTMPSNYQVIGPLYYDNGGPGVPTGPQKDTGRKTILVTMGSSGDWSQVSFLNEAYYSIYRIIAVGDSKRVLNNKHIAHLPFIGMHEIFPQVQLVICHGGNGTLYQALYYGVPTLVCTNHCEQEWNLDAFKKVGLAGSLDNVNDQARTRRLIATFAKRPDTDASRRFMDLMVAWEKKMPGLLQKLSHSLMKGQAITHELLH